jgi:Leucine-rich repeat (LRR) protein
LARPSDVSGPSTPASYRNESSFDMTPVKTSPELTAQVETLDALLAGQRTELAGGTPGNESYEDNDDLESELSQLAQSEALLRQELALFQGGSFFSGSEDEEEAGYHHIFADYGEEIDSPQAARRRSLSVSDDEEEAGYHHTFADYGEEIDSPQAAAKKPASAGRKSLSKTRKVSVFDQLESSEGSEASAQSHPDGHSPEPAGAGTIRHPPRMGEKQTIADIFRVDSPPKSPQQSSRKSPRKSPPQVAGRKRPPSLTPPSSTAGPRSKRPPSLTPPSSTAGTRSTPPTPSSADRRPTPLTPSSALDALLDPLGPFLTSPPSPIREGADYSMEVGDSLDSLFYSPTPSPKRVSVGKAPPGTEAASVAADSSARQYSPVGRQLPRSQSKASSAGKDSPGGHQPPTPNRIVLVRTTSSGDQSLVAQRPQSPFQPQAQSQSASPGTPRGVSILIDESPSLPKSQPQSPSEGLASSNESQGRPYPVPILTTGGLGAPSLPQSQLQLEDAQHQAAMTELDLVASMTELELVAPPAVFRRQDMADELDRLVHMDEGQSSSGDSGYPLLGHVVESRAVGIYPGADEYVDTIPTDYSNISSVLSSSYESGESVPVGDPFLTGTHDESRRQGSDQAGVGGAPEIATVEVDEILVGQGSLGTTDPGVDDNVGRRLGGNVGRRLGDNVGRRCAALFFVIILVSILVFVPTYFAVWRDRTKAPSRTFTPTAAPSLSPTMVPSLRAPNSTQSPTFSSTSRTAAPSTRPTDVPAQLPVAFPTVSPSSATFTPSAGRTASPTVTPSNSPSDAITANPTASPTMLPSNSPTLLPSSVPTTSPSEEPATSAPSQVPVSPTFRPSVVPTASPISSPTQTPSSSPSIPRTVAPSLALTTGPSLAPTVGPSLAPTADPTVVPTAGPSLAPTAGPTVVPTAGPSLAPTAGPTVVPTADPSLAPTAGSTVVPTVGPSSAPTLLPSPTPVSDPTIAPSVRLTSSPTLSVEQMLFNFLESVALDGGVSLNDPSSPQFAAYEWLAGNADLRSYSEEQIIQRYVLATFYFSTGGDGWLENSLWLSNEDECMWYSRAVSPCGTESNLQRLELYYNNVQGTIPPEIALLSRSLESIDVSGGPQRALTGTLPSELGLLTGLQDFRLQNNSLAGEVPSDYGAWTGLEWIDLSSNRLNSTLPSDIGKWVSLEILNFGKNQFQGTIPSQIGLWMDITRLTLDDNMLQGALPSEIGRLTNLQILSATNNRFTASIPSEIGLLTRLQFLSLFGNQFNGTLFTGIGQLTGLLALSVASNDLSGPIPSQLGELLMLRDRLDLSSNQFSGMIPTELGLINNRLRRLLLQSNLLSGSVPTEFDQLTRLSLLQLDSNQLTGEMPPEVCTVFNRTKPAVFIDCEEVFCPCCNFCCKDGEECVCRYLGTDMEFLCFF